ncbi:hypothetical protein SDC9_111851 [bioreactor metagenome]|uniref:Uncharacterized protein n=1 Tax=bioreactor metagenome TaxID=1076179 RepID=A0A645BHL9_9ZZZZ
MIAHPPVFSQFFAVTNGDFFVIQSTGSFFGKFKSDAADDFFPEVNQISVETGFFDGFDFDRVAPHAFTRRWLDFFYVKRFDGSIRP